MLLLGKFLSGDSNQLTSQGSKKSTAARKAEKSRDFTSVTLTTDGACRGNPGPGGWASLLVSGSHEKLLSGSERDTTNNRMELRAVIAGLATLKRRCQVEIVTDSRYVMDAFAKGWIEKWVDNGWLTADGNEVKNQDLWQELLELIEKHSIRWTWVKGHNGHPDNERVDSEARKQAASI
jgi:ribonuclease HI